jgi:hypothetical protein
MDKKEDKGWKRKGREGNGRERMSKEDIECERMNEVGKGRQRKGKDEQG